MSGRTTILLLAGMLAGIVLGFLLGTYAPGFMLAISFIGKLFIGALTILAAVLIVAGLVVGITRLGDYRKLGRSGSKSLLYFAVTGIIAVIIGIAAGYVFNPGGGYVIPGGA
ncbi:MAG: cation:dicarboxylase symporter family transporter, partial [Candidatus Zixiibacteriota bacterium]